MSKSNRKIRKVALDGREYYGYEPDKAVYGITVNYGLDLLQIKR